MRVALMQNDRRVEGKRRHSVFAHPKDKPIRIAPVSTHDWRHSDGSKSSIQRAQNFGQAVRLLDQCQPAFGFQPAIGNIQPILCFRGPTKRNVTIFVWA